MRFCSIVLLAGLLLMQGCAAPQERKQPIVGVYWQWDTFSLSDFRARQWRESGVTDIFVHAGTLRFENGDVKSTTGNLDWRRTGTGLPITLVLRISGPDIEAELDRDWHDLAIRVAGELGYALDEARNAGVRPKGLQIDLAEPVATVGRYADVIKFLRNHFRRDTEISATMHPEMLDSLAASQVARSADFITIRHRWSPDAETAQQIVQEAVTPADVENWVTKASQFRQPFTVMFDTQPTYFPLRNDLRHLTGQPFRRLDRETRKLRPIGPPEVTPGTPRSKVMEFMVFKGIEGTGEQPVLAAVPHIPGLERLLKSLPKPRAGGFAGPILSVPQDFPDDLSISNEQLGFILTGKPCAPEPQVSLRPFEGHRDRVVVRVDNVGCGRPALEAESIRLRITYPTGTVTHAERSRFDKLEALKTDNGQTWPVEVRSSDTLLYSATELLQGSVVTGPIWLNPQDDAKMRLTAVLVGPDGQSSNTSTIEVSLR